jgi:poly-gamma-glutamate synthesis protein (capsule biosynthesis protein)
MMSNTPLLHKLLVAAGFLLVASGLGLAVWATIQFAGAPGPTPLTAAGATGDVTANPAAASVGRDAAAATGVSGHDVRSVPTPSTAPALPVHLGAGVAAGLRTALAGLTVADTVIVTATDEVTAPIRFGITPVTGAPVYTETFVAATRFDTVAPVIRWPELQANWAGRAMTYTVVAVLSDTLPALTQVLGPAGPAVAGVATADELVARAWQDRTTAVILPFEQLVPRLAVLAIDGQNPLENANHFDPSRYPLVVRTYAQVDAVEPASQTLAAQLLAALPAGNRDPDKLTVVAMTGVTAMTRQTADQMERLGPAWPAEVVGPELASADITHISNEVPFVPGCVPNTDPDNFNFCSKPEYMATLAASGADIIGLTGNHQNDFGRENAKVSLDIYEKAGLPVYGGGRNKEAAFTPLVITHNGNRLAFLGANSYGPKMAWATDTEPGAAEFDLAILSYLIRQLKEDDKADVVLAELQYQESYDTQPLADQRQDFGALTRAGADIVTGVQSHVPQGMEFLDGKLILYGLGNLYFDQMWDQATREGMIVKHTIYDGRHLGTQILTTLLFDYGQPRWTTAAQRASVLNRVFANSYW